MKQWKKDALIFFGVLFGSGLLGLWIVGTITLWQSNACYAVSRNTHSPTQYSFAKGCYVLTAQGWIPKALFDDLYQSEDAK